MKCIICEKYRVENVVSIGEYKDKKFICFSCSGTTRGVHETENIANQFSKEEKRKWVIQQAKSICHYCHEHGETIDHMTPSSKYGMNTVENMVCCCEYCNNTKNSSSYIDFIRYIRAIGLRKHLCNKWKWEKKKEKRKEENANKKKRK